MMDYQPKRKSAANLEDTNEPMNDEILIDDAICQENSLISSEETDTTNIVSNEFQGYNPLNTKYIPGNNFSDLDRSTTLTECMSQSYSTAIVANQNNVFLSLLIEGCS